MPVKMPIKKILSGGQTGVDRAALDAGLALDIPIGGWCPRNRKAEDGKISEQYPLKETESDHYPVRTEWNIRDSDGTLILYRRKLRGGTLLTKKLAESLYKPLLLIDLTHKLAPYQLTQWLDENSIHILNIAGPRESQSPGIYQEAKKLLLSLLQY